MTKRGRQPGALADANQQCAGADSLRSGRGEHWFHAIQENTLTIVIPGRAKREPGIHNHDREYGFRACAKWRIHDVQLHIGE
jgi:hypothetical protein